MSDDQRNPYAPPAEPIRVVSDEPWWGGTDDYASERRPVVLCILLTFVTFGFYPSIWLLKRRSFLDRRGTSQKLGELLPILVIAGHALSLLTAPFDDAALVRQLFSMMAYVASLMANFRVLAILRSDSTRTGRFLQFSSVATFFLGTYYLQYKINQLADTPARVAKPKRKKKRKKPSIEAAEEPAITDV
jgi:hypothetical protein